MEADRRAGRSAVTTPPAGTSLLVLPFTGGGGDAALRLAEILADDVMPALSRLRWLAVTRGASSGGRLDPRRAGQDMGIPYVIHGAVQQDWNRLRVTVGLIETATGRLLWGDQQQVGLDEAAALRRRVPERTAEAVEQRLRRHVPGPPTTGQGEPEAERTMVRSSTNNAHRLVLVEGDQSGYRIGHEVPITTAPLTIGRMAPSDVILPSSDVSRAHCRVALVDGAVVVTDLNSTNGTFVDDKRLTRPTRLQPDELLKVGPYVMRYTWQKPAETVDVNATMVRSGARKTTPTR